MRKGDLFSKGMAAGGSSMQIFATALADVCYRIYGIVLSSKWKSSNDPRHHLESLFQRRIRRGECFRTPYLGWSEFTCSYWGAFREAQWELDSSLSVEIPSMLVAVWTDPENGRYSPTFIQDARIEGGIMTYRIPEAWLARQPSLVMGDA
jgi:CRISPR-associated protein Cas5d